MILIDHANAMPFKPHLTLCDDAGVAAVTSIGGAAATSPSTYMDQLVGRVFWHIDRLGRPQALRLVRADAAIAPNGTTISVAGYTVYFTAGKVGRNVSGLAATASGKVAAVIYDGYPANKYTIAQYDLFYVVAEGDVNAIVETAVSASNMAVRAYTGGDLTITANSTDFVVGVSNEARGGAISTLAMGGTTAQIAIAPAYANYASFANIHVWPDLKPPVLGT